MTSVHANQSDVWVSGRNRRSVQLLLLEDNQSMVGSWDSFADPGLRVGVDVADRVKSLVPVRELAPAVVGRSVCRNAPMSSESPRFGNLLLWSRLWRLLRFHRESGSPSAVFP